jgi:hypothetical protein
MAHQTSVNNGPKPTAALNEVVGNLTELSSDVASLAELQGKLFLNETKSWTQRAALPAGLVACAVVFLVGGLPVLLFGVAEWITSTFHISRAGAFMVTGCGALILAAGLAAFGFQRFQRSLEAFRYSREELNRNIAWLKTVISQSGRDGRLRIR